MNTSLQGYIVVVEYLDGNLSYIEAKTLLEDFGVNSTILGRLEDARYYKENKGTK